ncbi:prolyl oligopeptidase family serine peptidase [Amycolatopsis sp. NPDC051903]|uniref:alpha/beta hydrolase n=1 Tax=Amycolatopsis sp. NPDC051903 TaxID=3363936 RepID=UPI0037A88956
MSVIELTTFKVRPERTRAMLDARPGMVEAFRRDRRGFVSARLVRVADDTWLDFVEWTDDSAWDASRAKGGNQPEIAAFFATIDELVSSERGVRYDDAEDGPRRVRTVAYGPEPAQVGELYRPEGPGPFPVVVLAHGGFWTALYDRRQLTPLADDLLARGYAVWNVEYRRLGEPGGGWPGTLTDFAAAVDALAGLGPELDLARVVLIGHSAGGHLAAWAAGRATLPDAAPGAGPKVTPVAAVSLAGLLDLRGGADARLGHELSDPDLPGPTGAPVDADPRYTGAVAALAGDGLVRAFLGGTPAEHPDRYTWATPADAGVPLLVVHGDADELVPAERARAAFPAETVELPGAGHFDVIDPAHPSWARVVAWAGEQLAKHAG